MRRLLRVFLCGILCGVMMAAVVTFTAAIPGNNAHWRVEITKRGGGTWYFDKNGKLGWMWTVEPISERSQPKPISVLPTSEQRVDASHEEL